MSHLWTTIRVDASPETVYDLIADPSRAPAWQTLLAELGEISGPPGGVGSSYSGFYRVAGRRMEARFVVTAGERPRIHQSAGTTRGGWARWTTIIDPAGSGAEVRITLEYELPGDAVGSLFGMLTGPVIEKAFHRTYANLKRLAEADAGPAHRNDGSVARGAGRGHRARLIDRPDSRQSIVIPVPSLVVLVGAAGAGKSTFAARHFRPDEVLSSDAFRARLSGDAADQRRSRTVFSLLHREATKRLAAGRLVVIDATNVERHARRALVSLARAAGVPAVAIVLALPPGIVQERNAQRTERVVDAAVVERHLAALAVALGEGGIAAEGFDAVHVLRSAAEVDNAVVERLPARLRPARTKGSTRA